LRDSLEKRGSAPPGKPVRADAPVVSVTDTSVTDTSMTDTETAFAEVLAEITGCGRVPVTSHFFDDLCADSMVMARFCARIRKRADLPAVSMRDVYRHPTIRSLATAIGRAAPTPVEPTVVAVPIPMPVRARTWQYLLCGALQLLAFVGYTYLSAFATVQGYTWINASAGMLDIYFRSVLFGAALFVGTCILPILAKWVLVGRWKPRQIRIWSLAYFRFWLVKTLTRANPLMLFVGTPIYALYLRALGAKVGRDVVILSRHLPVCTDLLTVGDRTVIRNEANFQCYRAHAGWIQTGEVTMGSDVFVGETTVIDIGASLGDGAQLGHASSLYSGQAVPAGERWHGSPAQRTGSDYRGVYATRCGRLRRTTYSIWRVSMMLLVYLPLALGGLYTLFAGVPQLATLVDPTTLGFTRGTFYTEALVASALLFAGFIVVSFLVIVTVPRLLNILIEPDRVYYLYGFHYGIHRTIARLTNVRFFTTLCGDSSAIVHYLRGIGYDLSRVEQTGSNFGTILRHESPYLSSVGSGTMVADGLAILNADYSSTSFRVSRVSIGARNFLGNSVTYPAQGRTGDNCLIGTKAMVPIDGKVREGVGLLGSPSFEIPRTVQRDARLVVTGPDERRRRLAAKNRHNAVSAAKFLLARWMFIFGVLMITSATFDVYTRYDIWLGPLFVALANLAVLVFTVAYFTTIERASTGFRQQRPLYCSIYDSAFWRHERFWKAAAVTYIKMFDGTPFKNVIWRLLGVRIGRRVFDDGCSIPERTLVTMGDDVTLNFGSTIQPHSQEDGAFKSDRITLGSRCTIGIGAWVHYGVTIGDNAVVASDSFLMKGEEVPAGAWWAGNPAREVRGGAHGARPALSAPASTLLTVSGGNPR
jgi:non-ribosomal peptide synthetase-like protein